MNKQSITLATLFHKLGVFFLLCNPPTPPKPTALWLVNEELDETNRQVLLYATKAETLRAEAEGAKAMEVMLRAQLRRLTYDKNQLSVGPVLDFDFAVRQADALVKRVR